MLPEEGCQRCKRLNLRRRIACCNKFTWRGSRKVQGAQQISAVEWVIPDTQKHLTTKSTNNTYKVSHDGIVQALLYKFSWALSGRQCWFCDARSRSCLQHLQPN
eukprot:3890256-Amphidinium_carterae.1